MFVLSKQSHTVRVFSSLCVTSPWVSVCVDRAQVSICQQESDWLSVWGNHHGQEPVTKTVSCHVTGHCTAMVRLISCVGGLGIKAALTTGFIRIAGINVFTSCIMFVTIKSYDTTISNLNTLFDFSNGKQQKRDKMKCDQYLSGHFRVTNIVMGHLIYWYGRVGTWDWDEGRDGDCVISIPEVQIGPSRAQLIPIHFPSCNLSPITMLLQTSLHTTRRSHCSKIMQGENSQWTNQFSFSPKIHVMFHADPERY